MQLIAIIIIAVSVSMDTFSLSLLYGTKGLYKKQIYQLSLIVGIFHFVMPLIGLLLGSKLIMMLSLNIHPVITIIFTIIGIEMILSSFEQKKEITLLNKLQLFLFGLSVSIDSFSIGIVLNEFTNHYILAAFIFFIASFIFTFIGLNLGNKINKRVGTLSTIIGGTILIIIGFIYLFIA